MAKRNVNKEATDSAAKTIESDKKSIKAASKFNKKRATKIISDEVIRLNDEVRNHVNDSVVHLGVATGKSPHEVGIELLINVGVNMLNDGISNCRRVCGDDQATRVFSDVINGLTMAVEKENQNVNNRN